MAVAQQVSRVNEVLKDVPSMNKTGLAGINQGEDLGPKPAGENLGNKFHWAILKRDGAESVSSVRAIFFGE